MTTEERLTASEKEIKDLSKKLITLSTDNNKLSKAMSATKLSCKQPALYRSGTDFYAYATSFLNYMKTMATPEEDRVKCLLTYLNDKDFERVGKLVPDDDLAGSWNDSIKAIANVVMDQESETSATIKLLNHKQKDKSLKEFLTDIERLGDAAFPDGVDDRAKSKCLAASLVANVKSENMALELLKFQKSSSGSQRPYDEIKAKALELEAIYNARKMQVDVDDGLDVLAIQSQGLNNTPKRVGVCFSCGSATHWIRNCPDRMPNAFGKDNMKYQGRPKFNNRKYLNFDDPFNKYSRRRQSLGSNSDSKMPKDYKFLGRSNAPYYNNRAANRNQENLDRRDRWRSVKIDKPWPSYNNQVPTNQVDTDDKGKDSLWQKNV